MIKFDTEKEYNKYFEDIQKIIDLEKENQQLKDKTNEILDRNIKYNVEIVDLQRENQELKEELKYTVPIVEHNKIVSKKIKENQKLKNQLEELELQNFNLREDIMIKKISLPNEEIKDKTFFDLYDMPSYENLKNQQKEFIKYLEDKIEYYIDYPNEDDEGNDLTWYKETKEEIYQEILSKYKEIVGDK